MKAKIVTMAILAFSLNATANIDNVKCLINVGGEQKTCDLGVFTECRVDGPNWHFAKVTQFVGKDGQAHIGLAIGIVTAVLNKELSYESSNGSYASVVTYDTIDSAIVTSDVGLIGNLGTKIKISEPTLGSEINCDLK